MTLADVAPEVMASFEERLRRDRATIAEVLARLRADAPWHKIAPEIVEIEALAHRLAGAAGTFGYPALGTAASEVERLTEGWRRRPPPTLTPRRHALLRRRVAALLGALARAQRR
jgi:HPt (histidine-containing phosphotransfer) domain-containing protein